MPLTALHRFGPNDLNPSEEIIYRAHLNFVAFMIFGSRAFFEMLFGLALLALAFWFRQSIGFLEDRTITIGVFLFTGSIILFNFYRFSIRLIDWIYDEDIITNQRVIDYNQKFLFARDLTTANMRAIQHISLVQNGFVKNLFNYGSLQVHTVGGAHHVGEGEHENTRYLTIENISRPKNVQRLIDEIAHRVKQDVRVNKEEVLKACGLWRERDSVPLAGSP